MATNIVDLHQIMYFCISVSETKRWLEHVCVCVCTLLYYSVILHCRSYVVISRDPHTHQPAAFSEGPRPVDFLISSILQMKQKGVEIIHLIVVPFSKVPFNGFYFILAVFGGFSVLQFCLN